MKNVRAYTYLGVNISVKYEQQRSENEGVISCLVIYAAGLFKLSQSSRMLRSTRNLRILTRGHIHSTHIYYEIEEHRQTLNGGDVNK